jgi:hypothetical protein
MMKRLFLCFFAAVSLMGLPAVSRAQGVDLHGYHDPCAIVDGDAGNVISGDRAGGGPHGEPDGCSYWHAAVGFTNSTVPLLLAVLPALVLILAIWKGPWLFRLLLARFA